MSTSFQLPQNQAPTDPTLADALNLLKKDIFLNINCHHIGTVQSFDSIKQRATATVNYKKTFFKLNTATKVYNPVLIDYPMLIDCPVVCLGGGPTASTFPIIQGDECLVLFNDRDMDNWYQGGGNGAVATPRLHSFADGIILVGLRSLANRLTFYDPTRYVMRGGSARLGVNPTNNKVLLTNVAPIGSDGDALSYSTTLNTLLQNLVTEIRTLIATVGVINGAVPGPPVVPAFITAIDTNVIATATAIAGLLE